MQSGPISAGMSFGNYQIERELGQGGMGTVYLAKDIGLNRNVALKILRSDLGEDVAFAKKFLEEVEVTASLAHPNIIRVFTLGEQDERLYLVMEHLDEPSLEHRMEKQAKVPEKDLLEVGLGIASALQFAHEETGLIHRDIKPGNILFGRGNIPKLAEFALDLVVAKRHSYCNRPRLHEAKMAYLLWRSESVGLPFHANLSRPRGCQLA